VKRLGKVASLRGLEVLKPSIRPRRASHYCRSLRRSGGVC